jgi:hypothetical protein
MKRILLLTACLAAAVAARAQVGLSAGNFEARVPASIAQRTQALKASSALEGLVLRDFGVNALALINWKVGDSANFDIELGGNGKLGEMVKTATHEEGAAIWIKNEADLMGQKDVTEALINRADGKVLKMIHNGQEQSAPADDFQIISHDNTSITVPAGTFKCLHVVGKSKQSSKIEVWVNPTRVSLDGTLQMIAATQFGDMTMKLTAFKKN